MEGWSGSVVRDAYGPIGIVFEVNPKTNEAFAVRVDVIRRLMASGAPQTAAAIRNAGSTPPAIGVLAGVTDDPARGPDLVLGAGWRVTPVKRTVVFLAAFQRPTSVSGVALAAADGGSNGICRVGDCRPTRGIGRLGGDGNSGRRRSMPARCSVRCCDTRSVACVSW